MLHYSNTIINYCDIRFAFPVLKPPSPFLASLSTPLKLPSFTHILNQVYLFSIYFKNDLFLKLKLNIELDKDDLFPMYVLNLITNEIILSLDEIHDVNDKLFIFLDPSSSIQHPNHILRNILLFLSNKFKDNIIIKVCDN